MTAELQAAIAKSADVLRNAGTILLCAHVNPDGDALGSMLAMFWALRGLGKDPVATFPEPFRTAEVYRFLPGVKELTAPDRLDDTYDAVVVFDCASESRLHELQHQLHRAREVIIVDHHVSNTEYGTICVVDPSAASTGQVVHGMLAELGAVMTTTIATCIYTAIVADTGRFLYRSTTPDVFREAADLADVGVDVEEVSRHLFEESPFAYLAMLAEVLRNAHLETDIGLVWAVVDRGHLEQFGLTPDHAEPIIDMVRQAREAGVACVVKDFSPDGVRVSLRSRNEVDVAAISIARGGGGHRHAAGFMAASTQDAIDHVRACLRAGGASEVDGPAQP